VGHGYYPLMRRSPCSGYFPPPSPPCDKAAARGDEAGEASADDGAGDGDGGSSNELSC